MSASASQLSMNNVGVEQALLGAILLNNAALSTVGFLRPEHFSEPLHGALFEHIKELVNAGSRAVPATIAPYLAPEQRVGELTGIEYLARLCAEATTVLNAPDYGRTIFDASIRRQLAGIGSDLLNVRPTHGSGLAEQIADAEARLFELATALIEASPHKRHDMAAILSSIEDKAARGHKLNGIACGLRAIDEKLGGFAPGSLSILAGRPAMGKTAVGLSLARRAARIGAGVAFDSIEMPSEQITYRLLSDECEAMGERVEYFAIARGDLRPHQIDALRRAGERIDNLPLIINDKGNRLADIPGHIRGARKSLERFGKTLDLYIIDYLGLLRPSDRYSGNKVHETGEVSAFLKETAKREALPIIALHQLNRALERQEEKRPTLADLRDSGNIEQDADAVAFVYREHYYLDRPGARLPKADAEDGRSEETRRLDALVATKHDLEFIIAKNRQGPTGTARLWIDMATNSVRDLA